MEKFNFVKNGVSRLPPGFRFQPTDEELVFQYLKCKVFSCPLPASVIPEINACKFDPWNMPGNPDQPERYFFSSKEAKYRNGNRMNRTTSSGYWKATGSDKKVSSSRNKDIVGIRKTLVFHVGKSPHGSRTNWVMHEYRLVTAETTASACNKTPQNLWNEIGDWVLCRIFMNKRGAPENDFSAGTKHMEKQNTVLMDNFEVAQPKFFDFMMVHSSSSSSCSSSSSITEVSSNVSDYEETSGYTDF